MRLRTLLAAPLLYGSVTLAQAPAAGAKKAMTVDDYTRWKNINTSSISGDGKWVTWVIALTNTQPADAKPAMHLLRLADNQDSEIASATGSEFSNDSRWVAYQVDPAGGRGGRGGRGGGGGGGAAPGAANGARGAQQSPRVELRNLSTGAVQSWQDVQSFTFAANSRYIILRRRAANGGAAAGRGGAGGGAGGAAGAGAPGAPAAEPTGPRGSDVILHDLQSGRDQLLGSVADIAFNKSGDLLAYTVDAAPRDGNGLFVVDLGSGRIAPLENDAKVYNRLQWNDAGTALAVLKGVEVDRMRERDNMLVVYPAVRDAMGATSTARATTLDTKGAGFPHGFVISDRAALDWSGDGKRVFFGMKEQVAAPDTARRKGTDEVADVDIWNTHDDRIQSVQMTRADADRNFTYRESFDVAPAKFVRLADSTMRDVTISQDGRWAVGQDPRAYISDYKRPAADIYRVNTSTGERTLIAKGQLTGQNIVGISPDGSNFVFWKDAKYYTYNLDNAATKSLGATVNFTDAEYDHPGPRPSYGIDGYTNDGKGFVARHDYDLWYVPFDGSAPKNLTNGQGAKNEIRYRYVRIEADTDGTSSAAPGGFGGGRGGGAGRATKIDLAKSMVLSTFGEWTKKSGFAERQPDGTLRDIVYEDAAYSTPVKAAKADVFLVRRETFTEYPDLRVANGLDAIKTAKKITDANPQQGEYLWGHRQLIDFKDKDGHKLQALLTIPDDFKAGEKRPMLVNFYEKNTQNLHRYVAPSFVTGMGSMPIQGVSDGYLELVPDIYYHTGMSHSDQLNSVEAAVRKVIAMGIVDPKKIGINGHSYGGEGAAFIGTRSRLFAAVGVGAGVTDLYQDFSQNWGWGYTVPGGSGSNGNDYYLYGQGRWGFSPWEKPDVYMYESALTHVPEVTAPFLIMHGTADPTVAFQNGLGLYNALRYNGKNAVLLAYPGEGHGLRGLANRRDLTIRYFQFFDHYLKGAPAPKWLEQGVPYLQKNAVDAGIVP